MWFMYFCPYRAVDDLPGIPRALPLGYGVLGFQPVPMIFAMQSYQFLP